MGIVVTSGSLMEYNDSTLALNDRGVGSSPALGTIFPIFITPTTLPILVLGIIRIGQGLVSLISG